MISTKMLLIGIAAVVLVGGGIYFIGQSGSPGSSAEGDGQEMRGGDGGEPLAGTGNLRALLALGRNLTCDFVYAPDQGGVSEGTVYISGERMRGDFQMTMDGQVMESHVIRDGEKGYTWGRTPFGEVAVAFTATDEEKDSGDEQGIGLDEDLEYDCKSWRVDNSVFVPPSNIQFQDISAEMEAIQQSTSELESMQCSACDQIPDPNAQAQCRAALGC